MADVLFPDTPKDPGGAGVVPLLCDFNMALARSEWPVR